MDLNHKTKLKRQISLGTKLALAMMGLVLFSTIVISTFFSYSKQQTSYQELEQRANAILTSVNVSTAHLFATEDLDSIQAIVDNLSDTEILLDSRAYLDDGTVILSQGSPNRQSKIENTWASKIINSKTTTLAWHSDRLIAGKAAIVNDRIVGAIAIEISTIPLKEKLVRQQNRTVMMAVIVTLVTGLFTYYWSRFISEPLKRIITATQYLASGNLDCEIIVKSNDEFAILARTFNFMASELNKTVKDLQLRAEALHQSETYASDRAFQLKKTLEELKDAKATAERANLAKSTFLSSMSHELRTPLNGILGYAQILKRDRTLTAKQQNGLKIIYDSGNHLLTLINDILDLSKIEARKLELYPTNIHCQSFLTGIGDIIRLQAKDKGISFDCILAANLPVGIQADEKRLRQVLLNLLGNAVKFTDSGKVIFQVSPLVESTHSDNRTLRFEVIDTGVGMSPEQLIRIFQPFEQVGDIEKRSTGTGLGLVISMNLVTLMGGEIKVNSKLNRGSKFWFDVTFPVVETAKIDKLVKPKSQAIGYKDTRKTILVVDDKEENRIILLNLLAPLGFKIVLGKNGSEEVRLARKIQPDCIITDLVMPVMNGFEAVKKIRAIPELQDTVIIAISASVLESDRHKSRIAGCEAFLAKPIQEEQLLATLAKYLELEWIYEPVAIPPKNISINRPSTPKIESTKSDERLVVLPAEEVEILYELAMLGSMKKIRQRADYLEQLNQAYKPLADKLRHLAGGFKEKAIVNLIEQYL